MNTYDSDYYQWLTEQSSALNQRESALIDWEHLSEELALMGNEILRSVNSLLKQVIIHKLKLEYSAEVYPRQHWENEIVTFQENLEDLISNSLRNKIELEKIYQRAKREFLTKYEARLPDNCPYSLDELLGR